MRRVCTCCIVGGAFMQTCGEDVRLVRMLMPESASAHMRTAGKWAHSLMQMSIPQEGARNTNFDAHVICSTDARTACCLGPATSAAHCGLVWAGHRHGRQVECSQLALTQGCILLCGMSSSDVLMHRSAVALLQTSLWPAMQGFEHRRHRSRLQQQSSFCSISNRAALLLNATALQPTRTPRCSVPVQRDSSLTPARCMITSARPALRCA